MLSRTRTVGHITPISQHYTGSLFVSVLNLRCWFWPIKSYTVRSLDPWRTATSMWNLLGFGWWGSSPYSSIVEARLTSIGEKRLLRSFPSYGEPSPGRAGTPRLFIFQGYTKTDLAGLFSFNMLLECMWNLNMLLGCFPRMASSPLSQ